MTKLLVAFRNFPNAPNKWNNTSVPLAIWQVNKNNAVSTDKYLLTLYHSTRRHVPEDLNLQQHHCENLKYRKLVIKHITKTFSCPCMCTTTNTKSSHVIWIQFTPLQRTEFSTTRTPHPIEYVCMWRVENYELTVKTVLNLFINLITFHSHFSFLERTKHRRAHSNSTWWSSSSVICQTTGPKPLWAPPYPLTR